MRFRRLLVLAAAACLACDAPDAGSDATPSVDDPAPLRAMGNEPFWHVDVSTDGLAYHRLGEESIVFPAAVPDITPGDRTTFRYGPVRDDTGGHTLEVVITDEPCQDTMADQVHPMTSRVTIDGEELRGCARPGEAAVG